MTTVPSVALSTIQLYSQDELITWIACDSSLPDSDMSVLIRIPDSDDRVWIGYHDGQGWVSAEGFRLPRVTHWTDLPQGPEVHHGA